MKLKVLSFGIMALGLAVMGCSSKASAQKEADDQSGTFKFINYSAKETPTIKGAEREVELSLSVDAPVGNSVADKAITKWIREKINQLGSYLCEGDKTVLNDVPLDTPIDQAMVTNAVKEAVKNVSSNFNGHDFPTQYITLTCDTVTDKFITYFYQMAIGLGAERDRATFTVDSGKMLTYDDVLPQANKEKFVKLVNKIYKEENDSELGWTADRITGNVVFDRDGIFQEGTTMGFFSYIPVIVPYDQLRDIFTPEAVALFPAESEETKLKNERKELLKKRISEIYHEEDYDKRDKLYCSEEYLKVYNKAKEYDKKQIEIADSKGEDYYDAIDYMYSHWTGGKMGVPEDESIFYGKVKNMISPKEAIITVGYNTKYNEWEEVITLKMIWEKDNWMIADFIDDNYVSDYGTNSEFEKIKLHLNKNGISY